MNKKFKVNLDKVMSGMGYELNLRYCDAGRNVYSTELWEISIIEGLIFDNFADGKRGVRAIDLIMYLKNCSFKDAHKILNNINMRVKNEYQ